MWFAYGQRKRLPVGVFRDPVVIGVRRSSRTRLRVQNHLPRVVRVAIGGAVQQVAVLPVRQSRSA